MSLVQLVRQAFYYASGLLALCLAFFILVASLLFSVPRFYGHQLYVRRVGFLTLYGVHYSYKRDFSATAKRVAFRFRLPRPSDPRWGVFETDYYDQADSLCRASIEHVRIDLWLFPVSFRFTAGPLCTVRLDGFCIRVYSSQKYPDWIAKLRRNLVGTILQGQLLRVDDFLSSFEALPRILEDDDVLEEQLDELDFKSKHYTDGDWDKMGKVQRDVSDPEHLRRTPTGNGHRVEDGQPESKYFKPEALSRNFDNPHSALGLDVKDIRLPPAERDELRISAGVRRYLARNWQNRLYSFGAIDAQWRRSWVEERGSFNMIVVDAKWTKQHSLVESLQHDIPQTRFSRAM